VGLASSAVAAFPTDGDHLGAAARVADCASRIIRKNAGHRRETADVSVDDAGERDDRSLVGGDAVEVARVRISLFCFESASTYHRSPATTLMADRLSAAA